MKVTNKISDNKFKDLKPGDVFGNHGNLYLKVKSFNGANALNIHEYTSASFHDDCAVIIYDSELILSLPKPLPTPKRHTIFDENSVKFSGHLTEFVIQTEKCPIKKLLDLTLVEHGLDRELGTLAVNGNNKIELTALSTALPLIKFCGYVDMERGIIKIRTTESLERNVYFRYSYDYEEL